MHTIYQLMTQNDFVSSIKENELKENQMKAVRVKGKPILLIRQGGQVFGISNRCPHMGCTFERGILKDYLVMCPCHGWKFDIRNGQYQEIKDVTLECYRCKIQEGKIYIEIPKGK
jgi:nitrite reductase/ring-hydroxylating ferredoxin subunit